MNVLPSQFVARANRLLNLADFASASQPVLIDVPVGTPPEDRQYILRMMVRSDKQSLSIPNELVWMKPTIDALIRLQEAHGLNNPFIYVTVRHGIVTSTKDDEWHVDGFSMRTPHVPEQNYIYTSSHPTEWLIASWNIPTTFDPFRHNIHTFFQENDEDGVAVVGRPGNVFAIDPYCVHRRPTIATGTQRTMWRVSFIPIEIEDDECTQNPLFPVKTYNRQDVRKNLVAWRA